MARKLTIIEVDKRLSLIKIKRLEPYVNVRERIYFQCLECNYKWKIKPAGLLNGGRGCPNCAGLVPLTDDIVNEKLILKKIKKCNKYVNSSGKLNLECLVDGCGEKWTTKAYKVLSGNCGCPRCGNNIRLTNEEIDKRLIDTHRDIIRLGDVLIFGEKIKFKCMIKDCKNEWSAAPRTILNAGNGCPKCCLHKNEKIVDKALKNNIKIEIFNQMNIKNIFLNEIKRFIVDFYIPSKNIIIEYNGDQHYRPVRFGGRSIEKAKIGFEKQKERDSYLQQVCDKNNIKLIWINGKEIKSSNLYKYVLEVVIPEINNHSDVI